MARKKWQVTTYDKNLASQIAQDNDLNPFAALLATSRGLLTDDDISSYFGNTPMELCNPFELPDMDKAVKRLETAIDKGESILIFGDYDADGVTATALLYSYLETRGANVQYYIPDRLTEGYGISEEAVGIIKDRNAKLIVTVDNGISAIQEAKLIAELGMELIVTDHHKPKDILPQAIAIVDPHRTDCHCEHKDFAGVGVAFKLVCALDGGDPGDLLDEYGDLLAIGTIGDIVPLTGENRSSVKAGISAINAYPRIGISALLKVAGADKKKTNSSVVAFALAPRINAAGRMGSAGRALDLLLTDDEKTAEDLAVEINNENVLRRITEEEIIQKIDIILDKYPLLKYDRVIVIDGENWHNGVIGIVASRIAERFGRPAIIISKDGLFARGSGRSIEGFSLYAALDAVSDHLTHFGGHTLAAGFGILSEKIDAFRVAINRYAMTIEMPFPVQRIDFKLNPKAIAPDLVTAVEIFEPCGAGNPQPVFGLFKVKIESIFPVSEGKHTRMQVSKDNIKLNTIVFNAATGSFPYSIGDFADLAVQLEINEYKNTIGVNIRVINIRFSLLNEEYILQGSRLYESQIRNEHLPQSDFERVYPDRGLFARLYRVIREKEGTVDDPEKLCSLIGDDGYQFAAVLVAVDVMREMELLATDDNGRLTLVVPENKVDLENSNKLKRLRKAIS